MVEWKDSLGSLIDTRRCIGRCISPWFALIILLGAEIWGGCSSPGKLSSVGEF